MSGSQQFASVEAIPMLITPPQSRMWIFKELVNHCRLTATVDHNDIDQCEGSYLTDTLYFKQAMRMIQYAQCRKPNGIMYCRQLFDSPINYLALFQSLTKFSVHFLNECPKSVRLWLVVIMSTKAAYHRPQKCGPIQDELCSQRKTKKLNKRMHDLSC